MNKAEFVEAIAEKADLSQTVNPAQNNSAITTNSPSDETIIPEPINEEHSTNKGNKKKLIAIIASVVTIIIIGGVIAGVKINAANEEKAELQRIENSEKQKNKDIIQEVDRLLQDINRVVINANNVQEESMNEKTHCYIEAAKYCKKAFSLLDNYNGQYGSEKDNKQQEIQEKVQLIHNEVNKILEEKERGKQDYEELISIEEMDTDSIYLQIISIIDSCKECKLIIKELI